MAVRIANIVVTIMLIAFGLDTLSMPLLAGTAFLAAGFTAWSAVTGRCYLSGASCNRT
ncbi:hypothetical protein [Jonesia quinghaiensis]|uniref:hypothetical protein n=1 Tax=Jonesia quinghaiensis TaxID=262806 RepID=UPI00041EC24D|nr:hypothetical protein [Jonesia quinghaiensis]